MADSNVLIGSGGRRNYIVAWFREAMQQRGGDGKICAIDASPMAPALMDADRSRVVSRIDCESYLEEVRRCCEDWTINLAFSLNDFEASLWALNQDTTFIHQGADLLSVSTECQSMVEDKLAYAGVLAKNGLLSPPTFTGTDVLNRSAKLRSHGDRWIVKNRFGSGSAGLMRCTYDELKFCVTFVSKRATGRSGETPVDPNEGLANVVVQPELQGVEYGVDVVSDFDARFRAALARKKLRMRSGETDQAVTVEPGPLLEIAQQLASITQHKGLIDVDVLRDSEGRHWLLDVNPRFGGGYPFSHVAGANVPACYLAWHLGEEVDPDWLAPRAGVWSSKTEMMRVVESSPASITGSTGAGRH